jgi:hypothetical protein
MPPWGIFETDRGERHVVPLYDYREHTTAEPCWCGAWRDAEDEKIVVHNAADGRIFYETGERLPN